jgi:hypothetical protein
VFFVHGGHAAMAAGRRFQLITNKKGKKVLAGFPLASIFAVP